MTRREVHAARIVMSDEDRREIAAMVDQSLRTGALTLGPHTEQFEAAFRQRHEAPFAVAVSSGTAALEIIFRALGVGGHEVIVPTNTFFATAGAVIHAGGTLRLADVARETLALSEATVAASLTTATAAVVVVHLGGLISPDIDDIRALCRRRGILLIEDASHAHGSTYDGRTAGTFGHAAAFSFYPTKVITSGEGGMILTSDQTLVDEAVIYRDQGKAGFLGGDHVRMGYAWRMSELNAATGLVHLRRLDQFIATRRHVASLYDSGLADVEGLRPLSFPADCKSNYYKYVALLDEKIDRTAFKRRLHEDFGVTLSGEVYALPLHRQPVFQQFNVDHGGFAVADDVCARHICLPVHSDMTEDEATYVVESVTAALAGTRPTTRAATA